MALSPAVRVGILVFLAILAFVLVFLFLKGYTFSKHRYHVVVTYENTLGLIQGAEVRMAGVPIGKVASVALDENQLARVVLDINKKHRIPKGSRFVIQTGVLIAQQFIEVFPNRHADAYLPQRGKPVHLRGEMPARIEELLPKAQIVLNNLASTTEELKELVGDERLQADIKQSAANIALATAGLNKTLAVVRGTVVRSQDDIDAIIGNLRLASLNVRGMTSDLAAFAAESDLKENIRQSVGSARRSAEALERAVASVERTVADVERTAASVEALMTDPKFQDDIRMTVSEARQAAEDARVAISRVNRIFGGSGGKGPSVSIPTRGLNIDMLYIPDDDRIRAEVSTAIALPDNRFLELGLFDLGAGNKIIMQAGEPMTDSTDLRYGLYASRLGIGLDHRFGSRTFGRLDLYDTEDMKLNLRAGYRIGEGASVLLGVDNLFGENRATLGVQLAR
jgi:phospholipid/cholesterol/gamma-HCH transport system substrate-binding protein